jgi:AraC-like DNA-binding protein
VEVLIPVGQSLSLQQGNLERILRPPRDLLFLPAGGPDVQTSSFHGWRLRMDPEQLCQLAADLSAHRLSPGRCRRRLLHPRQLQPQKPDERDLANGLRELLRFCEATPLTSQRHLALTGLDRVIQRTVLLLLCGDLILRARRDDEAPLGSKARIIDDLIVWIQSNLDRPIQLQDLEARSGYSERSLRNTFHERFGCGPVHWIRSQRLEAARIRLLEPRPDDTVSQVATACGYRHLSQFSRDFQLAYGIRPSALLRESRRC